MNLTYIYIYIYIHTHTHPEAITAVKIIYLSPPTKKKQKIKQIHLISLQCKAKSCILQFFCLFLSIGE